MKTRALRFVALSFAAAFAVSSSAAPDYSVMPGADALLRINLKALQSSQMLKDSEATPEIPDEMKEVLTAFNLQAEDVVGASVSMNLENIAAVEGAGPEEFFNKVPMVAQLHFGKTVTQDQLLKGIETMNKAHPEKPGLKAVADGALIRFESPEADKFFGGVTAEGMSLLLGANEETIKAALQRSVDKKPMGVSAKLAAALDNTSHFTVAAVLPESVRAKIKEGLAGDGPETVMFKPFASLSTVAMGVKLNAADMDLAVKAILGTDAEAAAASGTLTMMSAMAAQQLGPVGQKIKFATEGSAVVLKMNLTKADIEEAMKGAMGGQPGGEPIVPEEEMEEDPAEVPAAP